MRGLAILCAAAAVVAGSAAAEATGARMQPETVALRTGDGGTAIASYWPPGTPSPPATTDVPSPPGTQTAPAAVPGALGVVLVHGAIFDRASWDPLARRLAEAGHQVMAIDLRRNVEGHLLERRLLAQDVLAAIQGLRARGATRISIVGASLGGTVATACLTHHRADAGEIERIALLAPAGVAGTDTLPGDKLVVISELEPTADRSRALFARMPEPKRFVALPGQAHAQHIFKTSRGPQLETLLVSFLSAPAE